jgi:CBS domain-containing protein
MKASDVMTGTVVTVSRNAPVRDAARLMILNRVSGLPVVDEAGRLIGIVTEGDFLRRAETGTERRRPHWLAFLTDPGTLAEEYVRSRARRVEDVMTPDPVTVTSETPLDRVVQTMEAQHIKRIPVVDDGRLVGIVSRADLLHALLCASGELAPVAETDAGLRTRILAELDGKPWSPRRTNVVVSQGEVSLSGVISDERFRAAIKVAVENVPGVTGLRDHLDFVDPGTGIVFPAQEDEPVGAPPKA